MTRPEAPARPDSFRPVVGVAVLLFLTVLTMAGLKGYHDLEAARQRERLLKRRIAATQAEIDRLHNRIERLHADPGALERLAREDMGLVRPGDVVIELPQDPVPPRPGTILPSPALAAPVPARSPAPALPAPH